MNPGEAMLAAYAAQHGLAGGGDHEPDLEAGPDDKRPDFRLSRGDSAAIVEVKEFESSVLHDRMMEGGYFALGDKDEFGSTRDKIRDGSRQLKDHQHRDEPLIVCLANPKRLWLSVADPEMLLMAMEGNPTFTIPIDTATGGPAREGKFVYGRDGKLGNDDHPYVSGVMFVHERTDHQGDPAEDYFVVVCESKRVTEGTAKPIPRDLFTGQSDEFWTYDSKIGQYVRVYGPPDED